MRDGRSRRGRERRTACHVPPQVRAKLEMLYGDEPGQVARLLAPRLDATEVQSRWWSSLPEGKEEMRLRIDELLAQVRYAPHEHVVLVAHSHLLRELFRQRLHPSFVNKAPELVDRLRNKRAQNCGIVCLELDGTMEEQPIIDVHLLLGTELEK